DRSIGDLFTWADASVVHEDVDASEVLVRVTNDVLRERAIGNVSRSGHRCRRKTAAVLDRLVEAVLAPGDGNDRRASLGQRVRGSCPDAGRRARHHRHGVSDAHGVEFLTSATDSSTIATNQGTEMVHLTDAEVAR